MPPLHLIDLFNPKTIIILLFLSLASIIINRLYLSPLSKIPGPKTAALTGLVEIYYDVIKGGQYIFKIEQWHNQYGPIIRITPWQVHIRDPEFYDQFYSMKHPRHNKMEYLNHRFNTPKALADLSDSGEHDARRAVLAPLFSRQRVLEFQDYVASRAMKLCQNLEASPAGQVIRLDHAWATYTTDTVLWYTLAMNFNFIDSRKFESGFTKAVEAFVFSVHWMAHFPILLRIFNRIPERWVGWVSEEVGAMFGFFEEVRVQIRRVVKGENEGYKDVAHRTVFHELVKTFGREKEGMKIMEDDGISITLAGIDTSKSALSLISFWLLRKPALLSRLTTELQTAIPDPNILPSISVLENLPFLTAIIQEGLRLSYGVSGRLTRYNPHIPVTFQNHVLPPGTEIAMSPALQHRNAARFPEPLEFLPDRWLGDDKVSSKYSVQFGKGPRMCLGMHLAMAELYFGVAVVFRRLGGRLRLDEGVGRECVDLGADFFVPVTKDWKKEGVRVVVD